MEGLLELIAAIPVPLDGTVFNLTLKLTDLGVFPCVDRAILDILKEILGFGTPGLILP